MMLLQRLIVSSFLFQTITSMQISYRRSNPQDIPTCFEIESASYPSDEAASLASLEYRQRHANQYFQCAMDGDEIIGFICATRCDEFEDEDVMSIHKKDGKLLGIHSVVVREDQRRKGIATDMLKRYIEKVEEGNKNEDSMVESIVLLAKSHLLGFYVNCGFRVNRPSPIVHGKELWYELERPLVRGLPSNVESWFCKTERFIKPFPEVKPHLDAHKEWVKTLRKKGTCMTSGYRVDSDGKPGGGGLMFLAAKNYEEAEQLVLQDPLVANGCVEYELNGWIGQVGNLQMR